MNHTEQMRHLHEALEAARPLLVGLSIRERLAVAREIEAKQRDRSGVEPLSAPIA
jgi:hypothetical protein